MKAISKGQGGFTLIELIMVIVILGILAVAVTSKYQDLQVEAINATVKGVAAEITSGSKINLAARTLGKAGSTNVTASNVCTETILQNFVSDNQIPAGYTISGSGDCSGGSGTVKCTITRSCGGSSCSANATIYCIN